MTVHIIIQVKKKPNKAEELKRKEVRMDKESLMAEDAAVSHGEQTGSCETRDASPGTIKSRVFKRWRGLKHPSDCEAARLLSLNVTT